MSDHDPAADPPLVASARRNGVTDARVLAAMRTVSRSAFVPPEAVDSADDDRPIAIGGGQTTSQPTLIAAMLAALEIRANDKVLEIGTGFGYQTALLSKLAAEVHSIDRSHTLIEAAQANLDAAGITGAYLHVGDGANGRPSDAPFDAIVVAAAAPQVPSALAEQLAEGGRMIIPVGEPDATAVVLYRRDGGQIAPVKTLTAARFVPLVSQPRPSD